jgi:hypothetical protein
MATVLFEIDGKPTPVGECSWLMYASGTPLHSDDHAGEETAVAYWTQVTDRQRPFVVHRGSIADPEHNTEGWDCPCLPAHYTAKEA